MIVGYEVWDDHTTYEDGETTRDITVRRPRSFASRESVESFLLEIYYDNGFGLFPEDEAEAKFIIQTIAFGALVAEEYDMFSLDKACILKYCNDALSRYWG